MSILSAIGLAYRGADRGPPWPIVAVVGLIALSDTQSEFGFARVVTIHSPLGMAIMLPFTGLATWGLAGYSPHTHAHVWVRAGGAGRGWLR